MSKTIPEPTPLWEASAGCEMSDRVAWELDTTAIMATKECAAAVRTGVPYASWEIPGPYL